MNEKKLIANIVQIRHSFMYFAFAFVAAGWLIELLKKLRAVSATAHALVR